MQQPRQRNKSLNSINTTSPYFTHVEGSQPPQQRHSYQQYSGYTGYPVDAAKAAANGSPYDSYGSQQQPQNHNPQAHSAELKPSAARGGGLSIGTFLLLILVWTGLLAGGGFYWWTEIKEPEINQEKQNMQIRMETLEQENSDMELQRIQLQKQKEKEMNHLREELRQQERHLREELDHSHARIRDVEEESVHEREQALELQEKTHRAIQEQSKQLVLQKYGTGPFIVEFEIDFPGGEHPWYFNVELAPLDEMPHTVYTFLEQISMGLYDSSSFSFHHNGAHIIFGSPSPNFRTPDEFHEDGALEHKFRDSGFGNVLFQEYSHNFPHHKYTLGFAGRNPFSGPGFYINMEDNSHDHGPGGYAEDGSADPCFAKVAGGHELVDRIHAASGELHEDDWKEMEGGSIAVLSVKLIH